MSRKRRTLGGRFLRRCPPRLRRSKCSTEAALASAKAGLAQAEINLQRTEVRSPVDGYVTNLLMRVGDFARAGSPNLSVIDEHSYWIDAYFEETKLANIHVGDPVERRCWASKLRSTEGSRASREASVLRTRQAARRAFQMSTRSLPGFGLRNEFRCVSGSNKSLRR